MDTDHRPASDVPDAASPGSDRSDVVGRRWRRPDAALLLTALVVLVGGVVNAVSLWDVVFDDAYITYRYAQNLAAGNGLVFNPGERVFGTSSPLQALLLATLGLLGAEVATAGRTLYALGWMAVAALGALGLRRAGSPWAGLLFAVWVFVGLGNLAAYWGMETPLYIALLLASLQAARGERDGLAGGLAGAAVLARYDGGVGALVLAALIAWRRRAFPWRYALAGTSVVLPWLLFAQLYYGSFLPNTLAAKAATVPLPDYLGQTLSLHLQAAFPLRALGFDGLGHPFFARTAAFLVAAGAFMGLRRALRLDPWILHAGLTSLLLWLAYGRIGPPPNHHWHQAAAAVLAGWFLCACWSRLLGRPRAAAVLCGGLGALALFLLPGIAADRARTQTSGDAYRNRAHAYRDMARFLDEYDLRDLTVLTGEPGYLSYLSGNPVIDLAGLVTRHDLYMHGPVERRASLRDAVDEHRPGLVVLHPGSDPSQPFEGHVDLFHAFSARRLVMREEVWQERFEGLADRFLAPAGRGETPELRGAWQLSANGDPGILRGTDAHLPLPRPLEVGGQPRPVFATPRPSTPWSGMETPAFAIDFDLLEFEFEGTHPTGTAAQLVVDGQIVLSEGGMRQWRDGEVPALRTIRWPVASWRGRTARLRFIDVAPPGHLVAVAAIRALATDGVDLEDFDPPHPEVWESTPPVASWRPVARRHGLQWLLSEQAASSLGLRGPGVWETRPFAPGSGVSLLVHDRCPTGCRVELLHGGEVERVLALRGSDRLETVTWSPGAAAGDVTLRLVDEAPAPARGLVVDSIRIHGALPSGEQPVAPSPSVRR